MNLSRRFPYLADLGLLVARVVVGVVFVAHGWQKFHDMGHTAATAAFKHMGLPLAEVSAFYATWAELLGGVALIIGLAVPIAGLLLFADMAGAFLFVHAGNGLFLEHHGYEFVLVLGGTSLALALLGSGRFGVDAFLGADRAARTPEPERADR